MRGSRFMGRPRGRTLSCFGALVSLACRCSSSAPRRRRPRSTESRAGKTCAGPINVGDPYVCLAQIDNTNSTSQGTVTTTRSSITVFHPDGTVAATLTIPINSSTLFPAGPVHLIDDGTAPAPSCDATECTIPFGDALTVVLTLHDAAPGRRRRRQRADDDARGWASIGDTNVKVASVTGMTKLGSLTIDPGGPSPETALISAVGTAGAAAPGTLITPLTQAHASGATVTVPEPP